MTDKELMQQALEALEWEWGGEPLGTLTWNAITALRERLAQPEQYQRPQMRRATREEKIDRPGVYWVPVEQEPVAYQFQDRDGKWYPFINEQHYRNTVEDGRWPIRALYTTPQPNTIANSEAIPEQISEPVAWMFTNQEGSEYCAERDAREGVWTPLFMASQLVQHPAQEPVAWAAVTENGKLFKAASTQEGAQRKANQQQEKFGEAWRPLRVAPLYTTPPRREWVGLTKEEAREISLANRPYVIDMVAALEAKLREKNT